MSKKRLLVFLMISLSSLVICGFCVFVLLAPYWPAILADYSATRALDVYPGSDKVHEAVGDHYYPNSDVKKRYYWTQNPVTTVQGYYEKLGYDFAYGHDNYTEWLIAGFDRKNRPVQPSGSHGLVTHLSFCLNTEDPIHSKPLFDCYTLALIDASQTAIHDLAVFSPSTFKYSPLPASLDTLPPVGTLIIFTYYREDIW